MAHEDYVNFEQAKALKKLGFDWEVFFQFNYKTKEIEPNEGNSYSEGGPFDTYDVLTDVTKFGSIPAPTLTQAAKWMREERGIDIVISPRFDSNSGERIGYFWRWSQRTDVNMNPKTHKSYESALSDAISTILKPFENYE